MAEPNWIELDGGANARDVGGLPTADGRLTRTGVLIRSANLQHLTEADLALLVRDLGVRTVVDLRTDVEVGAEGPGPMTGQPDVVIHHLSLFPDSSQSPSGVEDAVREVREPRSGAEPGAEPDSLLLPWHGREKAPRRTSHRTADLYLTYLNDRPDSVVNALRAIAESDGACLVHCAAGKDRTGVVIAIALALVGVERSAIVADYAATESRIAEIFALLARTETYRREVADPASVPPPKAAVMAAVLDALSGSAGGLEGWMGEHGWTQQDTARLRSKLLG